MILDTLRNKEKIKEFENIQEEYLYLKELEYWGL
jgi:hypothetical protein